MESARQSRWGRGFDVAGRDAGRRLSYLLASRRKRRLEVLRPSAWNIVRNGGSKRELLDLAYGPNEEKELSGPMTEKVEESSAVSAEDRKEEEE